MAQRQKYDFERLDNYCKENNVTLLEDYSVVSLTGKMRIKGNCIYENCVNSFDKAFRELENTGAYCNLCIKNVGNKKRKMYCLEKYGVENITKSKGYKSNIISPKYNYEKLENYCKENNVTLLEDYKNTDLQSHYFIKGKCSGAECLNIFNKKLHNLINRNSLCKKCSIEKAKIVRKETNLNTFGTENGFQNENIKSKIKKTILEKYGVEYINQNKEIRTKIKETCLKKYGFTHPSYSIDFQNKIIKTNIEKYGVEHLMKDPEYMENVLKKAHKFKDYILPSGKILQIQGYEKWALDELIINEKIDESDIITGAKNVPKILYEQNGKTHSHFVDIFIPSQNKCIEVKSTWTFTKSNVLLKQKAGKELGYNYEIWVYDKKGNKTCYDNK